MERVEGCVQLGALVLKLRCTATTETVKLMKLEFTQAELETGIRFQNTAVTTVGIRTSSMCTSWKQITNSLRGQSCCRSGYTTFPSY